MTQPERLGSDIADTDEPVWLDERDVIPSRLNRFRFEVRAWALWNYLNLRNARINIMDRRNENNGALSEQELKSEWTQRLGQWAMDKEVFSAEAQARYIANNPEVAA